MWYNYIRFDNPLEFGAKYQLTIVNMKELKIKYLYILIIAYLKLAPFTFEKY